MADVLNYPGQGANSGVPAPYLQGTIFSANSGLGGRIALGMGQMTRRFSDAITSTSGVSIDEQQLQSLFTALAQGAANQQVVNYNFEGLVGPPGPPGQSIVQYLPPINGIGQVGRYGEDGDDANVVYLSSTGYTFVTAKDGTTSPASVTLTATTQGIDSPTYQWQYWSGAAWTSVVGATNATLVVASGDFSGERTYRCLVSGSYYDSMTLAHLVDGSDAYTVLLTNEAHVVVCDSAGTAAAGELGVGGKATTDVLVYKGASALMAVASTPAAGQFSIAKADTNVTSTKVDNDTVRIDAMSADSGYVTITVSLEGLLSVTKRFTVVKTKAGEDAFADIDIPIPYTGTATKWEDVFVANDPSAGKVSWGTFYIKYKGSTYTIAANATGTSSEFIYWDVTSPTALQSTSTFATIVGSGKWPVCWNSSGTPYPAVPQKMSVVGYLRANVVATNHLIDLNVTTEKIEEAGVSELDSASSASGTFAVGGSTIVSVASVAYSTGYVRLDANITLRSSGAGGDTVTIQLMRGTNSVKSLTVGLSGSGGIPIMFRIVSGDTPAAATYTYSLKVTGGSYGGSYWNADLIVETVKK